MHQDVERVLLSEEQIKNRIRSADTTLYVVGIITTSPGKR